MEQMTQTEATDLGNYNITALSGWTSEITLYSIKYLVFHRIRKRGTSHLYFPAAVKVVYSNTILLTHIYTKSHILEIQNSSAAQFEILFFWVFFSVSQALVKIQG